MFIEFDGIANVRDLGGIPAADGKKVRPGRLLRGVVEDLWRERELPIVTACTELPLAYDASGLPPERQVSSLQALSDACLDALYDRR